MSTDEERPSKAAKTEAPSDTHRLEDILVPRRQGSEDEETQRVQLMKARDVRYGAALQLAWKSPDVMAYVRQGRSPWMREGSGCCLVMGAHSS